MFVTRAYHERVLREEVNAWHAALRNQRTYADARYDALLAKYHALRLAGGAVPDTPPAPLPKRAADRVTEVIADVAGSNSALRKQLHSFARKQRAEEKDDDDIIQALFNWQGDEEGVPA